MKNLLTSKEVAEKLKINSMTVNRSRFTGTLLGCKAPAFKKIGKSVRYEESVIEAWLSNLGEEAKA